MVQEGGKGWIWGGGGVVAAKKALPRNRLPIYEAQLHY